MKYGKNGILLVISGFSGAGKGTIVKELIKHDDHSLSISVTTRKPRIGEIEGVHYFFKSKEEFEKMVKNDELLEWAEFCGNYYGTPKKYVEQQIANGKNVILEIEVQGALKVKELYPEGVYVFVTPPSFEELKQRLIGRGTENMDVIDKRLDRANKERELLHRYDYIVVNDVLFDAVNHVHTIVQAEQLKIFRNTEFINYLKGE